MFFVSFMYILHEERRCSSLNIATLGLGVLAPLCTQNVDSPVDGLVVVRRTLVHFEMVLKAEDQKIVLDPSLLVMIVWHLLRQNHWHRDCCHSPSLLSVLETAR